MVRALFSAWERGDFGSTDWAHLGLAAGGGSEH
jgi:hypothetical protein